MISGKEEKTQIEPHNYDSSEYDNISNQILSLSKESWIKWLPIWKKIKFTSYLMLYTINSRSIKGIKWKFILVRIYRRMSLWCQDRIGCFKAQTMIEEIGRFDNLQILKLLTTTNNQKTPQLERKIMRGQEWRYLQCI